MRREGDCAWCALMDIREQFAQVNSLHHVGLGD